MSEEEKRLLLNAINENQTLIKFIYGLCSAGSIAIGTMAWYIKHLIDKIAKRESEHSKEIKDYADKFLEISKDMIQATNNISTVIEGNNKIIDRVLK